MADMHITLKEFGHVPRRVGKRVQCRIDALGVGQKMQDLPEELWHKSFHYYVKHDPNRAGGPNLRILRLDPNKPSLTVTGYVFNKFVHPTEDRYITPREAARLQGFPDNFLFRGTLTSMQRQVGNAVPIQLAEAIATQILRHLSEHNTLDLYEAYQSKPMPLLSLFSGAGGMDLGFLKAKHEPLRFTVDTCVEIDKDCCETLRYNFPEAKVLQSDVAKLDPQDLFSEIGIRDTLLPMVIGGPPCQAFSQAGRQNGLHDSRGRLALEFLRVVEALRPAYFVMENVPNLRGIAKGELYEQIKRHITSIGYNFTATLLCAADYGTPQLRRRLIFVGVQQPYPAVDPPQPRHAQQPDLMTRKAYIGVGQAFDGLPQLDGGDIDETEIVTIRDRRWLDEQ